ncbi:MAG: EI24 domain-containing protein [Planctomycetes bacterium]|nr:EI24 domain-containing protein [Planctomycetota bacterium]MCB9903734.1 EI24 domain-containing protein [Planctomycetota bacterium]
MNAVPCALCGYDAPGEDCPHCGHAPVGRGLGRAYSRNVRAVLDGALAVPRGFGLLMTTRGIKRWLIPPVVLTSLVFLALFIVIMGWVDGVVEHWIEASKQELPTDAGWWADSLITLLEWGGTTFTARTVGFVAVVVTSSLVALYTFSVAYEAIAGPFLDEIQGKLEEGWFGHNPRNRIQRPTELPVERCVKLTVFAGIPTVILGFAWLLTSGPIAWVLLALAPGSFVVAAVREREYGVWLRWVAKVESATLWVSIKASLLALLILALFFPLKFFFPPFGVILFFAIAGFSTAITLLDIPFSRRLWSFRDRLRFVFGNALPMTAFGLVSSLVFLIPVIGPIVMVPAASIGGLWLVCRLDKSGLRAR